MPNNQSPAVRRLGPRRHDVRTKSHEGFLLGVEVVNDQSCYDAGESVSDIVGSGEEEEWADGCQLGAAEREPIR